jgi:hypothetical protein
VDWRFSRRELSQVAFFMEAHILGRSYGLNLANSAFSLPKKYGDFFMPFFFFTKQFFLVGVATLVFGHQVGKFDPQKNMLLIIRGAFRLHFPNALGEPTNT